MRKWRQGSSMCSSPARPEGRLRGWRSVLAASCLAVSAGVSCSREEPRQADSSNSPPSAEGVGHDQRAASPATVPADVSDAKKPQVPIVLVERPVHDFGKVWVDKPLKHTFTLRNLGTAPLEIIKVRPSCGCTSTGKHPTEIVPGQSAEFPFQISGERFNGKFKTMVTIETNDPAHEQTKLSLTGIMNHYINVKPRGAYFGSVKAGSVLTRRLSLENNTDTPLRLSIDEEKTSETFKAELAETTAGQKYELTVTAGPAYPTRFNRFALEIMTNIAQVPKVEVVCQATLLRRLDLQPEMISVGAAQRISTTRRIRFTNNGDAPVKLLSAASNDERLRVGIRENAAGKQYDVMVTMPANYVPPPAGTRVALKTDDTEEPELIIPIRSIRRERPAMKLVGTKAPEISAVTFDGGKTAIGGSSKKVQLLVFYTAWCGYCKRALPGVEKLHRQFKDKGVEVVAINRDSPTARVPRTKEQVLEHYRQLELSMPMTMDSEDRIGKHFLVTSYPIFFLVSREGTIEAVHTGYQTVLGATLPTELNVLLQGRTRADFPGVRPGPTTRPPVGPPRPPAATGTRPTQLQIKFP